MRDVIKHRGPDDEGIFIDGPIGLGHRRLSIVDVASGHQPMTNEDGTLHITYNGEIYNTLTTGRNWKLAVTSIAPTATPKLFCICTRNMAPIVSATCAACSPSPSGTRTAASFSSRAIVWV